jgi:CheY-like chemotaxis protein
MDGYEATRRIREINSTIPIIAQSAYAFKQEIESFYSAGIDDYIIKPINQEKLLKTIVKKLRTNRESDH